MHALLLLAIASNMWYESYDVDIMGHSGRIALQVHVPKMPRYHTGSPVVVYAPGGFGKDNFGTPHRTYFQFGITFITFLFPGGTDMATGRFSEGIYDDRGPNCIAALYDVLRYAHGDLTDMDGRKITELSAFPIDTSIIGMAAFSNGGNITVAVLDIWGDSLTFVDYLVNWESPTSDQTILSELGGRDCDSTRDGDGNGFFTDDRKNPYYTAFGDTSCTVDYSRLVYDSTAPPGNSIFLDGNGNGTLDLISLPSGCRWEDVNDNGIIDFGEDYALKFYRAQDGKLYFSSEAIHALSSTALPPVVADTAETDSFWWWRASVYHFDNAAAKVPDLKVILVFSQDDHVQVAVDKPHIHQAFNGWHRNGIWVRLNPDEEYARQVAPPGPPGLPDNAANSEPANWNNINSWALDERYNSFIIAISAIAELCDREKYGVWTPDLAGVLAPPPPKLYFNLGVHIEESPKYFLSAYISRWESSFEAFAESLATHGGILANQFDWVIIEALEHYAPGFIASLESMGHEVTPHAHETVYSLMEVRTLLSEAGVRHPDDFNGHFMAPYWTDYSANHVGTYHASYNKLIYTSTNNTDRLNPWRPYVDTLARRWWTHDSTGPVVFVCNYGINGTPSDYNRITDNILRTSIKTDTLRVNARSSFVPFSYDADTLIAYANSIGNWFSDEMDTLVGRGIVEWASMDDIYNHYLAWETSHPGVNPVTDTNTVEPGDTTHYTPPAGWIFYTEWSDSSAGIPILSNNVVTSIAIDRGGKVWVGTLGGINVYDGTTWRWITPHNSPLNSWFIRVIYADNGLIWVGTDYGGLIKMDTSGSVLAIYDTVTSGLPSNSIHSIYRAHDGSLWVGMFHGGLARFDHGTWLFYDTSNGLPDNDVFAIAELRDTLYVGTSGGGVAFFDGSGFRPLPDMKPDGIGDSYIHSLEVHDGVLFAGTFGYGVARWDGASWQLIGPDTTSRTGLGAVMPNGMKFNHDTLYLATYQGNLMKSRGPGWTVFRIPSNTAHEMEVTAFEIDTLRNLLWAGTNRGVKVYNMLSSIEEAHPLESGLQLAVTYRGLMAYLPPSRTIATLMVFDVSGRKVHEISLSGEGWHRVSLSSSLPSGIYISELRSGDAKVTSKFVRLR